jgi:phasin
MANTETKIGRGAKTASENGQKGGAAKAAGAARFAAKDVADAAFAYPTFEVPEVLRSFAEQGLSQTRETYARVKAAAEEATDLIEESFEATREGVREVQFKALDAAQANTEATFDLMRKLMGVTSVADAIQLQTAFARERFEAFVDYSKDVQSTLTRFGAEASKPAKAIFDRALSQTKAA